VHRHSGNRTWRQRAAHSHPGRRITVPAHLRLRNRGCENAWCHATKENEFSPVHRFLKIETPRIRKLQHKIKGIDRVTFSLRETATLAMTIIRCCQFTGPGILAFLHFFRSLLSSVTSAPTLRLGTGRFNSLPSWIKIEFGSATIRT
jgi:hypothetical protein